MTALTQLSVYRRKVYQMLFFQIILVPLFALTLLGAVFMIGVGDTISPGQSDQGDRPLWQVGKTDPPGRVLPPL